MQSALTHITFLFLYVTSNLAAQDHAKVDLDFMSKVPDWQDELHVPAVGIGFIENGKLKVVKVFGELQKGDPAPRNTIFNIASQTKPVVGMMVLKLVESGRWKLDEPLYKYWIDPDVANDPRHKKLTTRHVLSHQTGFMNWRINHPTRRLTFDFDPGTKFQYSGEGFQYLAQALENKFDKPLESLLYSVLFKPLRMNDTRYWGNDLDRTRFASWHDADGNRYRISYRTNVSAADDLLTTVEDYCKLGIDVIQGAGLCPKLYDDMISPQVKVKHNYYRGLGWGLVNNLPNGEYALEHGGSDMGVRTMAVFLPKSKRGIVIMSNGDNGIFLIDRIIRESLNVGSEIMNNMSQAPEAHEIVILPDGIIERYEGQYRQPNGRFIRVVKEGNAIRVSGDGIPTGLLFPQSQNKFFWQKFDVQLEFVRDKAESVLHMIIYENGKQVMDTVKIR